MFINDKMKVIHYTKGNAEPKTNTKHVINFFGILGCIKFNALAKNTPKEQESELVKYYFDYPYFSGIVNPELFHKELNDEERKFTRKIVSLWLCLAISSAASAALLYLVHKNQKGACGVSFHIISTINLGYCMFYCSLFMDVF